MWGPSLEKSISNTAEEVRKQAHFSVLWPNISEDCARGERYCLDLPPGLIQALVRGCLFGGAAAVAVLQMSAAEVLVKIIIRAEGPKAAATCMRGGGGLAANVLPSRCTFRF